MVKSVAVKTQWRGQKDTQRWRFYTLLGFSFVLHSALTPWAALIGLLGLLGLADPVETEALPPMTAIPVDLFEDDLEEATAEPPKPEPAPAPDAPPALTEPEPGGQAFVEPAPEESKPQPGDPEAESEDERDNIADPVALSGSAGKVTDPNANVRLYVDTEKVRNHALGPRIGSLLAQVPQWKDFFGPTKIDPIRDIDRVLIAGPQLRDSSEVAAVLRYNLQQREVEAAVDELVKRSGGAWLDGPAKAATARADRADRVFVFVPENLVAVVPETAKKSTLDLAKRKLELPAIKGDAVLTVHVATPYRVFIGLPFRFPESVKSMKASVSPTSDGGARVVLLGIDESKEAAERNASLIESQVLLASTPRGLQAGLAKALFGAPDKYLESVEFRSEDEKIHGVITITAAQLDGILNLVRGVLNMLAPPPKPAPSASASGAGAVLRPPTPLPNSLPPPTPTAGSPSAPRVRSGPGGPGVPGRTPAPAPPANPAPAD